MQTRNKLYLALLFACFVSYCWVFYSIKSSNLGNEAAGVCFVKNVTGVPCPSCGSTRSLIMLLNGSPKEALILNPLGYLAAWAMFFIPCWILFDVIMGKETLVNVYKWVVRFLKKPPIAIGFGLLVAINWIWNISKGL